MPKSNSWLAQSETEQEDRAYFVPLSQREKQILNLLAQRFSDQEIADQLSVSYTTVKWYNKQIYNKLGVDSRKEAVKTAKAVGLLNSDHLVGLHNNNLPAQITPFVGRSTELAQIVDQIMSPNIRLITVLAPGGMGKTRLGIAAAESVLSEFSDGIFFTALGPLTSSEQIVPAITNSVNLQTIQDGRTPKRQLLDFLKPKRMLLVLDNFEHLLDGALLVYEILQAAPQIKLLITSRERLNLNGENVFLLGGLSIPTQMEMKSLTESSAVELFIQSAKRVQPKFVLQDEGSLILICQLVQGMPLALELAAAWTTSLSIKEIEKEIRRSIDFLTTTMSNIPPRLRSIRAVFDAAWIRLSADEQYSFSKLSVFHGGCTRDAAEVIADASPQLLANLVNKALLWYYPESGRYEIHELMRQYAAEKLHDTGTSESISILYRDYFGQYVDHWGRALKTSAHLNALEKLDADFENIREAFLSAIATCQPDLITPFTHLWYFFEIRSRYEEGLKIFEAAIKSLDHTESVALGRLLAGQGLFFERYHMYEKAFEVSKRSVIVLKRLGAMEELLMPLMVLGDAQNQMESIERAKQTFSEAYEIAKQLNDIWATSSLLFLLGTISRQLNQLDQAKRLITEAYILARQLQNIWAIGFMLVHLADIEIEYRRFDRAKSLLEEAIDGANRIRHYVIVYNGLHGLRSIALLQKDFSLAYALTEDAIEIERKIGNQAGVFDDTLALIEITLLAGDTDQAVIHFHNASAMLRVLEMPLPVLLLPYGAALCQKLDLMEFSITILSFIEHNPRYIELLVYVTPNWKDLLLTARSSLSPDSYQRNYELGEAQTLESLLSTLQILI